MDIENLAKELILKNMTPEQQMAVLESVRQSVANAKEVQKKKIGENVDLVVQALKKIEADIRDRFDAVGNSIEKRVLSIQDGRDGANGTDGRNGKDGKSGRDGLKGDRGVDGQAGRDGVDGVDGISVVNAQIDFDGSLVITLSDGRELNVGEVVSADVAEKIKVISTMSTNAAIAIKDEGSSISTGVKTINFVGATVTATNSGDDVTVNVSAGTGTVTSVGVSGGTTGLTTTGSPITTTGTITLGGTLAVASGGTGTATPSLVAGTNITSITGTWPNQTINASGGAGTVTSVAATAGTGISVSGSPITTSGTLTITNTAPDQTVVLTAGTGISTSGTYPSFTITNSAPDQTVALTQGGTTTITGTYPNFTISSADQFQGTVTSVAATVPAFLSITGSPVTTTGTLAIGLSGTALPVANGGTGITAFGTGVATALGINTGSSGAFVVNGGALGTPSSGTVTNLTGTASININGTVGATTANTGAFTTLSATGVTTVQAGTAALPAITTTGDTNTGIWFPAADTIAFTEGGVEAMRIDSSGNVGIGTTSPATYGKLAVYTATSAQNIIQANTDSGAYTGVVCSLTTSTTSTNQYQFLNCTRTGVQEKLVIRDTGNVQNVNNSYGALSDIKLKENIESAGSQWNDVKALSLVIKKFNLKADEDKIKQIGWIAQDVQLISPGLVSEQADRDLTTGELLDTTSLSVSYSVAQMKAFKALGEALIKIEELTARITALETN